MPFLNRVMNQDNLMGRMREGPSPLPNYGGVPILPGGRFLANGGILARNYQQNIAKMSQGTGGGGTGGNSFLGTFLDLAKWAVPYTSDVMEDRRKTKLDQLLGYEKNLMDLKKNTGNETRGIATNTNTDIQGQKLAAWNEKMKNWGMPSGITTHTPSAYAKDFNVNNPTNPEAWRGYGTDITGKVGQPGYGGTTFKNEVINQAGGIPSDMQRVMKKSAKTGAAILNPAGQVADISDQQQASDMVAPGQGEPLININPDGTWIEPTEEQLMSMLGGG